MTSSIGVNAPFVKLANPRERLDLTLASVAKWLEIAPSIQMVVCDGSGFDLAPICAERFPDAKIECLAFKNDFDAVQRYGKGYGEGQIVEHALAHSSILGRSSSFAKCTSKWWVRNFADLATDWNGEFQAGLKFRNKSSIRRIYVQLIDTRFYIVDKAFYLDRLSKAHLKVRDLEHYNLEHSFKDALIRDNRDALRIMFPRAARIEGVSGTSAEVHGAGYTSLERIFRHAFRRSLLMANTRLFPGSAPSPG